ncbi:MAG: thioredoxin [Spirochaetales bacterium]|nr:thioredoxin [Spirochaetales bacterium]
MALPPSFNELIQSNPKPVLVDFHALWCGPCKAISPIVQRLAKELSGTILTIKIDIDKKPAIAQSYGIQAVPTLALFFQGKLLSKLQGAQSYENIKNWVEKTIFPFV